MSDKKTTGQFWVSLDRMVQLVSNMRGNLFAVITCDPFPFSWILALEPHLQKHAPPSLPSVNICNLHPALPFTWIAPPPFPPLQLASDHCGYPTTDDWPSAHGIILMPMHRTAKHTGTGMYGIVKQILCPVCPPVCKPRHSEVKSCLGKSSKESPPFKHVWCVLQMKSFETENQKQGKHSGTHWWSEMIVFKEIWSVPSRG